MAGRTWSLAPAVDPLQGKRESSLYVRWAAALVLLVIHILCTTAANSPAPNGTAYVSQTSDVGSRTLLDALHDNSIQYIIIQQPEYNVRAEFEPYQGKPTPLNRNVTISSAPGVNSVLDLDFVASAVQLCTTCRLTFTNITVANERHGTGEAVDFVVGSPGGSAAVLFLNSNKLRLACSPGADAAAVIKQTPRTSMTAAAQQVDLQNVNFKGTQFPSSVHLIDVNMSVPHETVEGWTGGSGGYTLIAKNVSRLCYNTIDADCLSKGTPDSCVVSKMDELRAAADRRGQDGSTNTIAIAVGVSVAGVALLAAALGLLIYFRKGRPGIAQLGGKSTHNDAPAAASGQNQLRKVPSAGLTSSGYDDDLVGVTGVDVDQLRMFDSFIEGCNFVRAPLGVRKGWEVSKVLTSPYADCAPGKDIQLGQFLGAGSFGRVYRAKWGGRDVAVKVIEHNSDASDAVESEVELMFKFGNHPNIVRAFYAITYTQNSCPTLPNATGSSSSLNLTRDAAAFALNSSGGSSSNRAGIASCESGQRAALARLRSLPLQEIVVEDPPDSPAAAVGDGGGGGGGGSGGSARGPDGSVTPDRKDVPASRARPAPLERIDSDDQALPSQQQQQQLQMIHATAGAANLNCDSTSDSASARAFETPSTGFTGSGVAVRGSSLGSTDCVSRVYSWMGSSGVVPGIGGQFSGGKRPSDSTEGLKQSRAETWLVQEFCDRGTLGSIIAQWNPADEHDERMLQRLLLLKDAAEGLKLLHSMNTVHGDLTARNVLVSSSATAPYGKVAKLADLGLSRVIKLHRTHRTTNTVGTLSHMPPELLRYGHCSTAVDIYAFGVMMWELYTNKAAFNKLQYGQFYETVVLRNLRPLVPAGMPADYSLLMQHCWASDAMQRPNVDRLLHCLSLMIAERQGRLSSSNVQQHHVCSQPLSHNLTATKNTTQHTCRAGQTHAHRSYPGWHDPARSCPGPGGIARRPFHEPIIAAAVGPDEVPAAEDGVWWGPPSRFSWGERSGLGCSTPSAPLRAPLPLLRRYVSDDYGMELVPQEDTWVV